MYKVKIFTGDSPEEIEELVNDWFNNEPGNVVVNNVSYSHCPGVYDSPNTIGYNFSIAIIYAKGI